MLAAISSVQDDGLSGNQAVDLHGVPRSTLKDRLSGRVIHGTKSGPKSYLTAEEENEFDMHLGKTRRDVKIIVQEYLQENGKLRSSSLSDVW